LQTFPKILIFFDKNADPVADVAAAVVVIVVVVRSKFLSALEWANRKVYLS